MYEILCLFSSKIEEKQLLSLVKSIEKIIEDLNGRIISEKDLGEKKLAFPIKKEKKGHYWAIYFDFPGQEIINFKEKLKNISEILRYQIVKQKHLPQMVEKKSI